MVSNDLASLPPPNNECCADVGTLLASNHDVIDSSTFGEGNGFGNWKRKSAGSRIDLERA